MREGEFDAREEALAAVAREAGELAKRLFSNPPEVKLKGKQDFITAADGEVERLIIARLKERFPRDAFLGEEGGATGTGDAIWVIDPIDGTANFAHRIPHFCISIAFMSAGTLALGAISAPMYGELYRGRAAACAPILRSSSVFSTPGRSSCAPGQGPWAWRMWRRGARTATASCTSIPGIRWRGF